MLFLFIFYCFYFEDTQRLEISSSSSSSSFITVTVEPTNCDQQAIWILSIRGGKSGLAIITKLISKTYQFINPVNGVNHSHKQQICFLLDSVPQPIRWNVYIG